MTHEQAPFIPPENMYEVHKTDVKAVRELGGLAFAGTAEPGAEISQRSQWFLDKAGGDVSKAALMSKGEAGRINDRMSEIVSENLDQYIDQAREDMEQDKVEHIYQSGSKIVGREDIYNSRRKRGIGFGDDEPVVRAKPLKQMEAAIDSRTGQTVLPAEHYASQRSRYYSENNAPYSPNH
ncbi:MAG: hypothetical protein ACREGG_03975 [Candidatus Saccharimonadales bacterium]